MKFGQGYGDGDPERLKKRTAGSLGDEDWLVRSEACEALGLRSDRSAVPALIRTLEEDENNTVRWFAAEALADIGDPRALPPLESDYYRRSRVGRAGAARRLREAAVKAAERDRAGTVRFLVERLDAPGYWLRQDVREALGEIGDPAAVEPLVGALDTDGPWSRRDTVRALLELGDARALPALRRAIKRIRIRRGSMRRKLSRMESSASST